MAQFDDFSRRIQKVARDYREREGWLLGVCAGLGYRFGVNPNAIRLGTVVLGYFFPWLTIIAYLVIWFLFIRS